MNDTTDRRAGLAAVVLARPASSSRRSTPWPACAPTTDRSDYENPLAAWWADPAHGPAPAAARLGRSRHRLRDLRQVLRVRRARRPRLRAGRAKPAPRRQRWAERWGWRIALAAYALTAVSLFFTYWVANLDVVFLAVTIPSLLLSSVGERAARHRAASAEASGRGSPAGCWPCRAPAVHGLVAISTQALGMWPTMLAWGAAGWSLWRSAPDPVPATDPRPVAA